jgi:hypothetical protein
VNLLRWLWALPLSLPGLVLWMMMRLTQGAQYAQIHRVQGVWVLSVHGAWVKNLLKLYPFFEPDALCIGCVVLARDQEMLDHLWVHELVHVRQALRWGILFPVLYLGASLWAVLRGRDAYYGNPFEQEALRAETAARENVQKIK